jgi:TolB-like protein/Flp pilus assembly protein TadD/predicted Ser/Thr protein kinase
MDESPRDAWRRVREVFEAALVQPAERRQSFVADSCREDPAIRDQVLALLRSHDRGGDFLETPAATVLEREPREDLTGRQIGPYTLVSLLGQGGMGDVYRARDTRLQRTVAIKVLQPHVADDHAARSRFEREARAVAALNHPQICTLYDVGREDGVDFLVMEFLEGETLAARLQRGPLRSDEVIQVAVQIASALESAHRRGVVHRDLKPSNIILTESGAKLLDFGIAKLHESDSEPVAGRTERPSATLTGGVGVLGTIAYMSPEQVRGELVDERSDLFSFGAVIYEMSKGRRPFAGADTHQLCEAILGGASSVLAALDQRDPLDAIMAKALQPEREARYQSAAAMEADLRRLQQAPSRLSWTWRFAAAAVIAIAAVIILPILMAREPRTSPGGNVRAVAVLPFKPLIAGGGESDYLGLAIADALVAELGAVETVAVRSLSGSARYAESGTDPVAAGRELDAELVVDGAIQRAGDRLRVTVHLVRVADGLTVWSERFDARWTDVFSVQDAIAEQVARALAVRVTGEDRRRVARRRTENVDAYEAYLKGRYFWNSRTAEGLRRALGYFEQAIQLDPQYASAHAGLADTYAVLGSMAIAVLPPSDAGPKAINAAARALELDATLAEAHVSYAFAIYSYEWNWGRAEEYFRRAIALDPDYATAHYWYSLYLDQIGRVDEALAEAQRALELDPLSLVGTYAVGLAHYSARRFDLAREYAGRVLEVDPDYPLGLRLLGTTLIATREHAEAVAVFERLARSAPTNSLYAGWLAHAYGRTGEVTKAHEILSSLTRRDTAGYVSPSNVAIGYIGIGDYEAALKWLENAYVEHSQALTYLKVDSVYDPLRSDPRFADLVRRVGLAP